MKLAKQVTAGVIAAFIVSLPLQAVEVDQQALKKEAISIVKRFGGSLKPELKKALKAGGSAHAISVCSEKAPAIARQLRSDTGWYIKRVSLKPRNPSPSPTPGRRRC